ncbi:fucose-binding lectin II [Burkholderia dolosa]|jgi:hypothetical protein|uniref:Calcium-mediated lectin domain-containing protein n=1 Tax=Burkholderia dolosa TaxID=152500 RepID=A0A892I5B5_9BURK|nr:MULTISPECIES: fucose-binding lectin II [Burkholderia]AKE05606.1 hypothetical protein XM57_23520 [Burkholderia cepacia]AJY09840.1 fucose-binding lectin II family protein [Burkholderia dolosa AU0158]AYZ94070.1 hypothetical protein EGY28_02645 [Burkholderia dolosa]ETP63672.1 hypothetical protein BDSB_17430 [Burkholderia dolosa PC543]MBR8059789.1 hypothetical protein [Burkholderia dolosa]
MSTAAAGNSDTQETIQLETGKKYGVTVLVNSTSLQTVNLYLDGGATPAHTFTGQATGPETSNMGTYVFTAGSTGKASITVTSGTQASALTLRDVVDDSVDFSMVVIGAGAPNSSPQLFNDVIIAVNGPL